MLNHLAYESSYFVRIGVTDKKDTTWSDLINFSTLTSLQIATKITSGSQWSIANASFILGNYTKTLNFSIPDVIVKFDNGYIATYSHDSSCYNTRTFKYNVVDSFLIITDTTNQPNVYDTTVLSFANNTLFITKKLVKGAVIQEALVAYSGQIPYANWPQGTCNDAGAYVSKNGLTYVTLDKLIRQQTVGNFAPLVVGNTWVYCYTYQEDAGGSGGFYDNYNDTIKDTVSVISKSVNGYLLKFHRAGISYHYFTRGSSGGDDTTKIDTLFTDTVTDSIIVEGINIFCQYSIENALNDLTNQPNSNWLDSLEYITFNNAKHVKIVLGCHRALQNVPGKVHFKVYHPD